MADTIMLVLLLASLSLGGSVAASGINPVQHSERTTTQTTSQGINPVQHSE
jgi:hypothetical protein